MLKSKPYYLLFFLAVIVMALSFVASKETVAINVGATYYVVANSHFYVILSLVLAVVFLIYQLVEGLKLLLKKGLVLFHVLGTLLSAVAILTLNYLNRLPVDLKNPNNLLHPIDYNGYLIIALLALACFQLFLIMNIFAAVINKFRNLATR
ncbi:hypothetical protein [Flavobacterium sp. XGLA_31]|uniref:hypothetical protein n=1 Tax=Flavobacterium sp. XGLA_31 TaxID=3447666 RepID=UPI003F2CC109